MPNKQQIINSMIVRHRWPRLHISHEAIKKLTPQQLHYLILINIGYQEADVIYKTMNIKEATYYKLKKTIPTINIISEKRYVMMPISLATQVPSNYLHTILLLQTNSWCRLKLSTIKHFSERVLYYMVSKFPILEVKDKLLSINSERYKDLCVECATGSFVYSRDRNHLKELRAKRLAEDNFQEELNTWYVDKDIH